MSDLHSPTEHTLLMTSPRCTPSPRRRPLRSGKVAAGSTTSEVAMMVGVMNRSTDTLKSQFMRPMYISCGSAPMQASTLFCCSQVAWIL